MASTSQNCEVLTAMRDSVPRSRSGFSVSKKLVLFLSMFFVSAVMSTQSQELSFTPNGKEESRDVDLRLPTELKPVSYLVKLQPLINGNFTTFGYVEITFDVLEPTTNVTLQILDIITKNETIKLNPIDDLTGPGVEITENLYDNERSFYIANLGEELVVGQQYVLAMEFEGYLNDQLAGFYRSQYTNDDDSVSYLAVSQFEPTDARRAFPCFDEPAMKAEFEIYLARQTSMSSISNMPLVETIPFDDDPDWVWDRFNTSLPMSSYLVAFIVSDFTFLNSTYNDHVLFRVWAREEAIDQTEYAREAGPAILTWYEEYFNIPFPLPKQDMIAIPDFSAGAMENWGLITYRESAMLYDPELSSAYNKERVAVVVAHELAHQWFGDLVTMEWWQDIWLNEGFATYMEYQGTNSFEPTWNKLDKFVVDDLQYVLAVDSLESSHQISIPVQTPDQINELFDDISYSKGGSILRMINNFLTEPTFRAGLTNYLNANKFGNANQDDLWAALTDQAHADGTLPEDLTVKIIMDTWTLQMGYPVISVTLNGDGTATLEQERFLLVKNPNSTDTNDYKWWVPITFASQESPDFSQTQASEWIPSTETSLTISGMPAAGNWVIFNVQETGYYRVNYEASSWQLIVNQLLTDYTVINLLNRAQVLDDALNFARAGQLPYETALSVNSYLDNETEYVPWSAALENLSYLEEMFTRTGGYGALKHYLLELLTPLYYDIGFEDDLNDPHMDQYKRSLAVSWSCKLGLEDCTTKSVNLYSQWMADPTNQMIISPNLKSSVYCTAIGEGGEEEWDFAWNQYLTTNLASERDTILSALGCSNELWILSRYLEMAYTDDSSIRKQDSSRVFSSVAGNDIGRDLAWDYLQENIVMLSEYYQTFSDLGGLVESASNEFNTNEQLHELLLFKENNEGNLGNAARSVDQSIERATNNIAWMDNYYGVIFDWLQENGFGKSASS